MLWVRADQRDMARPIGKREVTIDKINQIVELTLSKKYSRPEIARMVGVSRDTVWRYQKLYDLV